jgi:DNA (cytosine-5)-methyltransferase 1
MNLTRKAPSSKKDKGKQICDAEQAGSAKKDTVISDNCLATLDIFAGCGGLSEGLQLSGKVFPSAYIFRCMRKSEDRTPWPPHVL